MGITMGTKFQKSTQLTKAGILGILGAVITLASQIALGYAANPEGFTLTPDMTEGIQILVIAGALAFWGAFKNWWKNMHRPGAPKWVLFGVLLIAIANSGCLTMTPAGGGKTKIETSITTQQPPTTDPATGAVVAGEQYQYARKMELPAGVSAENAEDLDIGIDGDGSWHIRLNQSETANTQGQMDGLVQSQAELMQALAPLIEFAISQFVPVLSQQVAGNISNEAAGIAAQAQFRALLIEALRDPAVLQVLRPAPAPALVPQE